MTYLMAEIAYILLLIVTTFNASYTMSRLQSSPLINYMLLTAA